MAEPDAGSNDEERGHAANAMDVEGRMWTYLPYGPFDTLASYQAWTEQMSCRSDPLFCAIIDRTSDRAVGVASDLRIDPPGGSIEVGHISYSPLLQPTPAATEAMFLMMERAFALGYRRYEWKCDALNGPSRAAAQRLGFSFEGVLRQATVVKGRNRDTAWFAPIDREWPSLREAFQRWLRPANFDAQGKQRLRLSALTTSHPPTPIARRRRLAPVPDLVVRRFCARPPIETMKSSTKHVDGPTKERFTDGSLSGEGHLKNGKRHGRWQFYHRNGKLKAVGRYLAGELEGHWEWWRESGQPLQAGAFKNAERVGLWRRYYESGQLWDEGSYADGKKCGEWKTYDKSGALKQSRTFRSKQ